MLADYLSCYKFNNKTILLPKGDILPKPQRLPFFHCYLSFALLFKFWSIQTLVFINLKKKIFLQMHSAKSCHTGSAFTQLIMYAVCYSSLNKNSRDNIFTESDINMLSVIFYFLGHITHL